MSATESLQDVAIRERQLEAHILRSADYLRRADQDIKRQVVMLYLAIALLMLFQGFFTFRASASVPLIEATLIAITSLLAIINCLLLIQTKRYLRQLNEKWLNPAEKIAFDALKHQRHEILSRLTRSTNGTESAQLN